MEKLLLTPEEAAAALGICRSKLYELLQAGVIESVHIGASRRITVAAMVKVRGAATTRGHRMTGRRRGPG
jgi:excisionase family DNA binding protein